MILLSILDIKDLMNGLLRQEVFDNFWLHSLELKTLHSLSLSGQIHADYLTDEEKAARTGQDYLSWQEIRPLVLQIIKNYRRPEYLQIDFILPPAAGEKLLKSLSPELTEAIAAFSFRLRFEGGKLDLITATNYKGFLPDKSAEHLFDQSIRQFLSRHGYGHQIN